jgi:5'-3' exonuclease
VTVWAMREVEADDALATAAARAAEDPRVGRALICTPDKDLAQCVGGVVVQLDRRARTVRDAAGVRERFGVGPESIPDYLALVGDSADGFPGLPGWGAKSAAAVLARYVRLEEIPDDEAAWDVTVRGAPRLAAALRAGREAAELFRFLATLRRDVAGVLEDGVDAIAWRGPTDALQSVCEEIGAPELPARARALAEERAGR